METDELLSVKDVTKILGCRTQFVYSLIERKLLRPIKLGNKFQRFTRIEVNRMLKEWQEKEFLAPEESDDGKTK